jgi:hypothetical protein
MEAWGAVVSPATCRQPPPRPAAFPPSVPQKRSIVLTYSVASSPIAHARRRGGMTIRLETSTARGIDNHQNAQVTHQVIAWDRKMQQDYPNAIPRTKVTVSYNCHGLTFASRRTWVYKSTSIQHILGDDHYEEIVDVHNVLPGDIAIYYSDKGDPNHSGVVVGAGPPLVVPVICSKWANTGEFIHSVRDCPTIYGPTVRYYRCTR